ncbi:c-type cytochrome [Thiobacillus sp. 0-1251]|uniref:c-type cytochrome n=1 Tax=Thiobacillus sp. 0-1251 TaxID=1895858 RepID=UPI000A8CD974|nr:c-type cytochrome [Thiobacillus sp. 0-1251]
MPARHSVIVRNLLHLAASVLLVIAWSGMARAAEPSIEIAVGAQPHRFTRTELLRHPALRSVEIRNDVAYHRTMRYQAIPLSALITSLPQVESLQFIARDGFVANIPSGLLAGGAQPWLAIEPADAAWPALKPGGGSAGPFYLVWRAPKKAGISPEQWPYQIARIADAAPLETRYPQIQPRTAANSAERRGMQVFVTHCAVCHTINGGGDAAVGPDLNRPFNPTEYFNEPFLRKLIRDPASVRNWGRRSMPGFAPTVLGEAQLDDLLAYLRQMAIQR